MPNSSVASYLFLFSMGLGSALLYLLNSHYLDRIRAIKQVLAARKDRLITASAAQHNLRVAMSLHDGLSGLAAVAERSLQTSQLTATSVEALTILRTRLQQEIAGSQAGTELRSTDLSVSATSMGIALAGIDQLRHWDPTSAEDMLDMLTELLANCSQHGAQRASSGAIEIARDQIKINIRTASPRGFSVRGRGLRNIANRIATAGGTMSVNTTNGSFHIEASVPNRRSVYAPPFAALAMPSIAVMVTVSFAVMTLLHAWFSWPLVLFQLATVVIYLHQLRSESIKQRQVYEQTENALLAIHIDKRQRLVSARLGHYQKLLAQSDTERLLQHLAAFRIELGALLFALEWQGDSTALAHELGIPTCVIPDDDRVNAIHALVLQTRQEPLCDALAGKTRSDTIINFRSGEIHRVCQRPFPSHQFQIQRGCDYSVTRDADHDTK
jgi:hypothetical protein